MAVEAAFDICRGSTAGRCSPGLFATSTTRGTRCSLCLILSLLLYLAMVCIKPNIIANSRGPFTAAELGRSWHVLITLPWQLVYHQPKAFSSFYFFLLPLPLAFAVINRRIRFLLALTAGFTLCWFFRFQEVRYLIPVLPLMSIAVAAPIDRMLLRLPLKERWGKHKLITAAGIAILMYPGWQYAREAIRGRGALPINQELRDRYLAREFRSYPVIKYLNDLKHNSYTVYAMFSENMTYFSDGLLIGDPLGPASYHHILDKLTSGEALYRQLKTLGADYFLATGYRHWSDPSKNITINLPTDSFFQSHFKPIYEANGVQVFELSAVPFARKLENLIQNAGFEELKDKQPTGWRLAGDTIVDSSGKQSFTGQTSVRCNRSNDVIYQTLSITSGGRYLFSCEARGVMQPGTVKLQANWYDNQGQLLKEAIKVFDVGVDWTRCETSFDAPANAASVTAYASPLDPGPAWFDDFSFGTITYEPVP